MTHDPLQTLLRLRQRELDAAREHLMERLAAEQGHIAAEHAARAALRREEAAAASLESPDAAVEAFAAWLPVGRRAVATATNDRDRCAAELVQARAVLALARAGVESIEATLQSRGAKRQLEAARREQLGLDEIGLVRRADDF